jgi:hypothetical protein
MRVSLAIAVAASTLALAADGARAGPSQQYSAHRQAPPSYYRPPSPASDFSAFYYQSPGGLRGAGRGAARVYAYASSDTVPYPQSCGSGRAWNGERCVRR